MKTKLVVTPIQVFRFMCNSHDKLPDVLTSVGTCMIDNDTQKSRRLMASRKIIKFLWLFKNFADFSLPLLVIFVPDKNDVVSTVILLIFYYLFTSSKSSSKHFKL